MNFSIEDERGTPPPTKATRSWTGVLVTTLAALVSGCTLWVSGPPQGVQPESEVRCGLNWIEIDLRNVGTVSAKYVVEVEIAEDDTVETERYSSNDVEPGETITLRDPRPGRDETCRIISVQVYEQE